jgi:hypothetical protein
LVLIKIKAASGYEAKYNTKAARYEKDRGRRTRGPQKDKRLMEWLNPKFG